MRIVTGVEGGLAAELAEARVRHTLRLAFRSYSAEVRNVAVHLSDAGEAVECSIRANLRGSRTVEVCICAPTVDEALRFACTRAGAAIARRLDTDRALRG